MSAGWGFVGTTLSFCIVDVLVQNKGGPAAVTGAFGSIAKAVSAWVDPYTPAIANHAAGSTSSSSSGIGAPGSLAYGATTPPPSTSITGPGAISGSHAGVPVKTNPSKGVFPHPGR